MNLYKFITEDTWIISDTHFGHDNVLQFEPCRLESMKEKGFRDQNEWLIHNWNSVVKENDLVLHLGDFLFMKKGLSNATGGQTFIQVFASIVERLNGRIVMIVGNHDYRYIQKFKNYEKNNPNKFQLIEGVPAFSENTEVSGLIREINGKKVFFSHYPLISEDPYTRGKSKDSRDFMAQIYKTENCDLCIHGHLHSNDEYKSAEERLRERNVSLEKTSFKPVKLFDLIN